VFEVTSYRKDVETPVTGNCFPVVPGRGYVLRTFGQTTIDYAGYDLTEAAEVYIIEGWNLVGVNGVKSNKYTAEGLIDHVGTQNMEADNVTKWREDASKYDGLQKEEGELYGFDFPLYNNRAYFLRVTEGEGVLKY
jgi:hypothetical protein